MSQSFRLPAGGAIDRSRRLAFTWEGRVLHGHPGDTLASALVANGVRIVGRSFKYHRPRGLVGAGVEDSNALVQLGTGARSTANLRATEVPLYDGLVARPVNCWPNARIDIAAGLGLFARFLGAGFYYKTFMWPHWHWFEGPIRRMAGLGRIAAAADPDRYESRNAHCDVLVVGAGPAGLAAAQAAAATGARVILAEQDFVVGGQLLVDDAMIDGEPGADWAARVAGALAAMPDVRLLLRTTVIGYHDHKSLTLVEEVGNDAACAADPALPRQRLWTVRAGRVILATGAIERPLVFPGNDRPGVMLAGAVRHYLRRHAALPGRRAVIVTNNDDAYRTALALADAGATVAALVDVRDPAPAGLAAELAARGIPLHAGTAIVATRGKVLSAVRIRHADGSERWRACDLLAMSGGHNPAAHLFSQSGGTLEWDEAIAAFVPGDGPQAAVSIGAAAGCFDLAAALKAGHAAGGGNGPAPAADDRAVTPLQPCWQMAGDGTAWVDFQNDVTTADIAIAAAENFRSVEHLKRYTTLGMAPDQGKTANVNALALMAAQTGRDIPATGHTRYRPPYVPVALGAFAGRRRGTLYRPLRQLPAHDRHVAAGAHLEDAGGWLRAVGYPRAGETLADAEQREALAVRTGAGLFDASPLGKIEVVGPDAAAFLDRIYANAMASLKPGRVRYGLMLDDNGVIIDDGVCVRLADAHFLVCTSSAGADRIALWLDQWLQCEWSDLDVIVAPVTAAWGVLTLTGPEARALLASVGTDIDLGDFPHMRLRTGSVAGLGCRVLRVSYTGETSYEINVPARDTALLWDRLLATGKVTPVGIDAWMVLRTEKGYLHIGSDTDGTTNPIDVGWGHVLKRSGDFLGRRSLLRPADQASGRLQFVGLEPLDAALLPIGGHVVAADGSSDGYVTASVHSPVLGRPIALAMLRGGRARLGEIVSVRALDATARHRARVVAPQFYDPDGARLRG
ncbi:sarcosine oxidase subunit alpha family protein [Sandarakinorhabdus sp. DWP1-3-1]|uniref:sarcosine oxidase subunit alpha family protein n=1 Tax=Sandarakinorhabdus sp. DWP1-3-1 TaxID=2804627 RepID=UPI003CEA2D68